MDLDELRELRLEKMKKKNLLAKVAKVEEVAVPVLPSFNESAISSLEEIQQENIVAEIDRLFTGVLNFYFEYVSLFL